MWFQSLLAWIQNTPSSTAIRESIYVFPILEGTHLLGLAMMMAPILMFDLRLIGVIWQGDAASKVKGQFLPMTFAGFALMVTTGSLLFWSEPVRCWESNYFRIKFVLLLLAGLNALVFHSTLDRHIGEWDTAAPPPARARLAGVVSLTLWTAVIFAGRYTAYHL
jgi:hypothetical protein